MSARDRLLKKRPRTAKTDAGDFQVRALTIAETQSIAALNDAGKAQESMLAILGYAVLEDDGQQMFKGADDPDIASIPMDVIPQLSEQIAKLGQVRSVEKIEKNSDATP